MKSKIVKVFCSMALSLTLATSFMASSAHAQTQKTRQDESSVMVASTDHTLDCIGLLNDPWCEEANSEYHYVYDYAKYTCSSHINCEFDEVLIRVQIGYEAHDLRGTAPSPYRFRCLDCGYVE